MTRQNWPSTTLRGPSVNVWELNLCRTRRWYILRKGKRSYSVPTDGRDPKRSSLLSPRLLTITVIGFSAHRRLGPGPTQGLDTKSRTGTPTVGSWVPLRPFKTHSYIKEKSLTFIFLQLLCQTNFIIRNTDNLTVTYSQRHRAQVLGLSRLLHRYMFRAEKVNKSKRVI